MPLRTNTLILSIRSSVQTAGQLRRISMATVEAAKGKGLGGGERPKPSADAGDAIKEGDPMTKPSLSASVMLLAPLPKRTEDGFDFRILLLKRHSQSSTFLSASVFPGGNAEESDTSSTWSSLYPPAASEEERVMRGIQVCAIRETFEESGVLLAEQASGGTDWAQKWEAMGEKVKREWRDRVHADGKVFAELFKALSPKGEAARPALSSLQYRANWITPRNMKRRFDTHFFLTILPPSLTPSNSSLNSDDPLISVPVVSSDGKETVRADWLTPTEAISRTLLHTHHLQNSTSSTSNDVDKALILFPPQFYLLAELARTKSYQSLLDPASLPLLKVHRRKVLPFEPEIKGVKTESGEYRAATVLPGDPEHSSTEADEEFWSGGGGGVRAEERRHRTYVLLPAKEKDDKWRKKPPLGLTVMGVHRRGLTKALGPEWEDMREGDTGEGADGVQAKL